METKKMKDIAMLLMLILLLINFLFNNIIGGESLNKTLLMGLSVFVGYFIIGYFRKPSK